MRWSTALAIRPMRLPARAGEGHEQPEDAGAPARVPCERPGVDDPEHGLPQRLEEAEVLAVAVDAGDLEEGDHQRGHDDDRQGEQAEPPDHHRRPPGQGRVESVAEARPEADPWPLRCSGGVCLLHVLLSERA
jgi:hypothetical protein